MLNLQLSIGLWFFSDLSINETAEISSFLKNVFLIETELHHFPLSFPRCSLSQLPPLQPLHVLLPQCSPSRRFRGCDGGVPTVAGFPQSTGLSLCSVVVFCGCFHLLERRASLTKGDGGTTRFPIVERAVGTWKQD